MKGRISVKPLNTICAVSSFLGSTALHRPLKNGMPLALSVELTNICNLGCPECSTGSGTMKREKGFLEPDLFSALIGEIGQYLFNVNLYFQGESMLHPDFFSFLSRSINVHTTLSTNGHFLNIENSEKLAVSGLNKIIISLDGADQETYSSYRINGSYSKVTEGIKNLCEAKTRLRSKLGIYIQFLVNRFNEHQVEKMKKFAAGLNARLILKSMHIKDKDSVDFWMPSNEKFRRYRMKSKGYVIKSTYPNRCARLWFNPVVTWDGKVLPCCFDKDAEYVMGDLKNETFREIWNGREFMDFRQKVLVERDKISICRNCTSGMRGL